MATSGFSEIEVRLHMFLDRLSNYEPVEVPEELIDEAVNSFRDILTRRLNEGPRDFRLRPSNIGRPVCQLQMEKSDAEPVRNPYNHVLRMFIGDAVEIFTTLAVKAAGVNVTGGKSKVSYKISDTTTISGENDLEIDGAIWDVKSSSPYAFEHKWQQGWSGVWHQDSFGYVDQLYVYAEAEKKPMGGWIVADKSSGEILVVPAEPTKDQLATIKQRIQDTEQKVNLGLPFAKCFEDEEEVFRKKPTGNMRVPTVCTFCPYMFHCWPNAVLKPQGGSKAKNPKPYWYTKYVPSNPTATTDADAADLSSDTDNEG